MTKHIEIIAICHGCYGMFQLLWALFIAGTFVVLGSGFAVALGSMGEAEMALVGALYVVLGLVVGGLAALWSVPALFAAYGLYYRLWWARILAMVVGCMALLSMPVGTILGVYTLYVLLDPEVEAAFKAD